VGPITALTWTLEVGDVQRFSSIKKPSATAGVRGRKEFRQHGATQRRCPKQRNKHLQTTLTKRQDGRRPPKRQHLAGATMLLEVGQGHSRERNANGATLAVARKLVAYLVAVDRRQKEFLTVQRENRTAA